MMKNKLIKILLLIFVLLILFSNCKVYAGLLDHEADRLTGLEDPTKNPDVWDPLDGKELDEPELSSKAGKVLSIINIVGVILSVIALILIGLKYLLGSVEEKADFKKQVGPYLIGVFLIASATTIPNIIFSIMDGIL